LGFQKSNNFSPHYRHLSRSLFHLLWVQSQLPRAHDKLVLNKGNKLAFLSRKNLKSSFRTRRNKETGYEAKMNGKEALIRLMQGLWSNFLGLSSLILHSTPASNGENTGNKETESQPVRGTMHFTCSTIGRPRWVFRKATFHHLYAIDQRSRSLLLSSELNPSFLRHMMN
jgi:hypothetical protein